MLRRSLASLELDAVDAAVFVGLLLLAIGVAGWIREPFAGVAIFGAGLFALALLVALRQSSTPTEPSE